MGILKRIASLFAVIIMLVSMAVPINVSASVAEFGTQGSGSNPFNPRGYYVELTDGTKHWLSSKFETPTYTKEYDDLGHSIYYTGVESGLDYVDADLVKSLYCTTDRNPGGQGAYKEALSAFCKSSSSSALTKISNMSRYINAPARSYELSDANGDVYVWTIKIDLDLQPGTMYEFAFLRGLIANNGTSCVLASDNSGYLKIPFTAEEEAYYNAHKYDEYEYVTKVAVDESRNKVLSTVPMRYKVQTYADLTAYEEAASKAEKVLNKITDSDLESGVYDSATVDYLKQLLNRCDALANSTVKKYLQVEADATQNEWISEINELVESLKSGMTLVDLTEFNKTLSDAEKLYSQTKDKVGADEGCYGEKEVNALKNEIDNAKRTIDELSSLAEVNKEIDALEKAILDVKKSLVLPDKIIFHDKSTGIYVTTDYGALPDNVKLYVGQVLPGDSEYDRVIKNFSAKPKNTIIYKILFMQGNTIVEPIGTVKIQIPVLKDMNAKSTAIYSVGSKSNKFVKSSLMNGSHVFETEQMGEWVLIEAQIIESDKDTEVKTDNSSSQQATSNFNTNQSVSQQTTSTETPPMNESSDFMDNIEENEPENNEANELDEVNSMENDIKKNELENDERLPLEVPELDLSLLRQDGDDDRIIAFICGFSFIGIIVAFVVNRRM